MLSARFLFGVHYCNLHCESAKIKLVGHDYLRFPIKTGRFLKFQRSIDLCASATPGTELLPS
jgi:hypothetical protein